MSEELLNPYCSLVDLQSELRNTESARDDQFTRSINAASRWVDSYVGRDYFMHDYSGTPLKISRYDEYAFEDRLFLPFKPVVDLIEVKVSGTVLVEGTDFFQLGVGVLVVITSMNNLTQGIRRSSWAVGDPPDGLIEIKGIFGYRQNRTDSVPVGIPENIRQATILVAAAFSGHNQKDIVGLDGSREQVIDKAIPKSVYDILGARGRVLI